MSKIMKQYLNGTVSEFGVQSNSIDNQIVRANKADNSKTTMRPTIEAPAELLFACNYFNDALFMWGGIAMPIAA